MIFDIAVPKEKDAKWKSRFALLPVFLDATRLMWLSFYETRTYLDGEGYTIKETRLPGEMTAHKVYLNGE